MWTGWNSPFYNSIYAQLSWAFHIPDMYKGKLPAGNLPIYQAIAYTDMALRKFFTTAAQQPWYNNTCLYNSRPSFPLSRR